MSLCRGCAGSGVDISASPRAVQIAGHGLMIRFPEGAKRKRDVLVTLDLYPLAELLARINGYAAQGGVPDHPFPLTQADLCSWCNGHGDQEGQLSTHALEVAIKAPFSGVPAMLDLKQAEATVRAALQDNEEDA